MDMLAALLCKRVGCTIAMGSAFGPACRVGSETDPELDSNSNRTRVSGQVEGGFWRKEKTKVRILL